MPVQWQRLPMPLAQGIDTKTDDKQSPPGSLVALENCVFTTPGEMRTRQGLTSWSTTIEGGGSISSGSRLAFYQGETLVFASGSLWTRLGGSSHWSNRGSAVACGVQTDPVVINNAAQYNPAAAYLSGVEVYAWEDSRWTGTKPAVRASVIDSSTRANIVSDVLLSSASAEAPRCFAFSGSLYVGYVCSVFGSGSSTLIVRRIDPANPSVIGAEQAILPNGVFAPRTIIRGNGQPEDLYPWDAVPTATRLCVVHNGADNGSFGHVTASLFSANSAGTLTRITSSAPSSDVNQNCLYALAAWGDPSGNYWLTYFSSSINADLITDTLDMYGAKFSSTLAITTPTTKVATFPDLTFTGSAYGPVVGLSGICVSGSTSNVYFELSGTNSGLNRRIVVGTFNGATVTTSSFLRGLGMVSKPFIFSGSQYLWTAFDSTTQPTYFLVNGDGSIIAKASSNVAGGARINYQVPDVAQVAAGVFRVPNQRVALTQTDNGQLSTLPGVASTAVTFNPSASFPTAFIGNRLLAGGGLVQSYDGLGLVEHGFHVYPESVTLSGSQLGGSIATSGSYQYVITYEWKDAYGQVERSTTSIPVTAPVNGASLSGSITLTIPTLRLGTKNLRVPVQIGIYRTEMNGATLFYKVTSGSMPLYNTSSIDSLTYADAMNDAQLISREILYTNSGELDNEPPPVATLVASWQNRAWLAGLEDPLQLSYSKQIKDQAPPHFSSFLTLRMDPRGGDVTAIQPMDDKLVVFKEQAIHAIFGSGFDNGGGGINYAQQLVTHEVGTTNPRSVVLTDEGIYFVSAKGICLLDRSMQVNYVGAAVEGLRGLNITGAANVPAMNLVIFTSDSDVAVAFDTYRNQWSTFRNHQAVDAAVLASGMYALLRSDGRVSVSDPSTFTDDGSSVPWRLQTSWVSLAGINGYQRARRLYVLGDWRGPHSLSASIAYDYVTGSTGAFQTALLPATDGTVFPPYQFRIDLAKQKCTAIQVTLQATGSSGESARLSNLSLEVGLKQGGAKVPWNRQGGTQ